MAYKRTPHNADTNHFDSKPLRRDLRTHGTAAEASLWALLKNGQIDGYRFRRQFAIGPYVMDFYCPTTHVCVELDGEPHFTPEGEANDARRTKYLEQKHGIKVLRFENRMVFEQAESVIAHIREACTTSVQQTE